MPANSIEANQKRRETMLKRWKDPAYIKKHLDRGISLRKNVPHYCSDCGKENDHRSARCLSCASKYYFTQPDSKPTLGKTYEQIFGIERANEIKAKMSANKRGVKNHFYGKHHSGETKQKLSQYFKSIEPQWRKGECPEEVRQTISQQKKELYKDPTKNPMYGRKHTPETLEKMSVMSLRNRVDPAFLSNMFKAMAIKPTKPERALDALMQQLNLPYRYVGDGQFILGGKCPDFLNTNGQKKIIELYGNYWHKDDDPQDRIDLFADFGFETLVIWERELKEPEEIKAKLLSFDRGT